MSGVLVFPGGHIASAGKRYSRNSRTIRPGLTYMQITDSQGPNRIKVLKIDPSTNLSLDVALANNTLPGRETTSSMAKRHGAIAGINGNFGTSWGRPIGILAEDGRLQASPMEDGGMFALSNDETTPHVGYQDLKIYGKVIETGKVWPVSAWNETSPNRSAIAVYTRSGGDIVRPPENSCSVRLIAKGKPKFNRTRMRLARRYNVDALRCGSQRLLPKGGLVLSAGRGTKRARLLAAARKGQSVDLGWSVGWEEIVDAIGGSPVLVKDGQVLVDECGGYVCQRHPRTGVGYMPNGDVLLVTVDGRQSGSVGMEIQDFARLFRYLGAEGALNLDGGGSSTMVLRGHVVNSPSDSSGERQVVSSLLVLPERDKGQPRNL